MSARGQIGQRHAPGGVFWYTEAHAAGGRARDRQSNVASPSAVELRHLLYKNRRGRAPRDEYTTGRTPSRACGRRRAPCRPVPLNAARAVSLAVFRPASRCSGASLAVFRPGSEDRITA